jgi:hypothetical protein
MCGLCQDQLRKIRFVDPKRHMPFALLPGVEEVFALA